MIPSKHAPSAAASLSTSATPTAGAPVVSEVSSAPEDQPPQERVVAGLASAAYHAALAGMALDEFMQEAWSAFVDARPGLREHLADAQLVQQIQELRAQGKVGSA